jgi:hypothetical protein
LGSPHAYDAAGKGLWNAVNEGMPDYTEDRMALEVISKTVHLEMMGTICEQADSEGCVGCDHPA